MDEGRLKAVKKGQRLHRKFAYAMNDTIRNRQEYYQSCLSREEQEAHARLLSKVMSMRRTVVRNSLLLQCLNLHRKNQPDRAHTEPLLGSYGGRPIDSFSRDIDQRLAWFHPRLRRLRKVDRIKQNCIKHGAILDEDTIKDRMQDFFSKNLDPEPSSSGKSAEHDDNEHLRKKDGNNNNRNDNDDDDDFDIRDYDNPIGGASIKLRLHPFGHMIDLDNGGDDDFKKFNLQKTTKIFSKRNDDVKLRLGDVSKVDGKLLAGPGDSVQVSRVKSEPSQTHKTQGSRSTPPSVGDPPLRLSKYPSPLPPIASGNPQKTKSKGLSAKRTEEASKTERQETEKQTHLVSSPKTATDLPVTLRLSHVNKQKDSKEVAETTNIEKVEEDVPKLTRRKTLILPPLETSKEMMKKK